MDTIRAKRVIARLFAILKQRRAQPASRIEPGPFVFALPKRAASSVVEPHGVVASGDVLSPEALRDVYWLLQRWRGGSDALDEMMALYRRTLLRRGWSEPTADARISQVRRFVSEALGIADSGNAATTTTLHRKLHRLRHALDRLK